MTEKMRRFLAELAVSAAFLIVGLLAHVQFLAGIGVLMGAVALIAIAVELVKPSRAHRR